MTYLGRGEGAGRGERKGEEESRGGERVKEGGEEEVRDGRGEGEWTKIRDLHESFNTNTNSDLSTHIITHSLTLTNAHYSHHSSVSPPLTPLPHIFNLTTRDCSHQT